jgi:hypothetical protein
MSDVDTVPDGKSVRNGVLKGLAKISAVLAIIIAVLAGIQRLVEDELPLASGEVVEDSGQALEIDGGV